MTALAVSPVALYLWIFVQVILHEGAHVLAGKALGFRPLAVTIGQGPLLFARSIGGIDVRIHLLPLPGFVRAVLSPTGLSWKGCVFSIAGILSDVALLALLLYLAGGDSMFSHVGETSPAKFVFRVLALYQAIIVLASIIPADGRVAGMKMPTDGKQFLWYASGRMARDLRSYERTVARYEPAFRIGDSWLMRGDLAMAALFLRAEDDMAAGRYAEGTEKYLRIIEQRDIHPAEKAMHLDRLACIPILHGDKGFLPAADGWSRQAHELVPHSRTIRGTRGAVLVERGFHADGLALLMPLTSEGNSTLDRTLASCFVAKALQGLGRGAEAREWIKTARSYGDALGVCARIEAELETA